MPLPGPTRRLVAVVAASALALAGCGGSDDPADESSAVDPVTTPATSSAEPAPSTRPAPSRVIPDDFPLTAGWPRRPGEPGQPGLTGPNRTLSALDVAPCDVPAADPAFADRLRSDWEDIEDFRSRQLTSYATVAAASTALDAIVATYRSCPEHASNPQSTTSYALERTSYGDASWAVAATETYDGYPTTYLGVWHFVRVGLAVLVTADHGEGGAGPPGTLERNVRRSAAEAEAVIAAMCTFAVDGC